MTDFQDRLIEISLDEELGGHGPPDQVNEILAAARQQTDVGSSAHDSMRPQHGKPKSVRTTHRQWSRLVQSVAWFGSMAAIFWLALVLRDYFVRPQQPTAGPGTGQSEEAPFAQASLVSRDGFMMPVSTQSSKVLGRTMLQDGWMYADRDSRSLMVGVSLLEFENARAVVRVGGVPDSYGAAEIARQLELSEVINSQEDIDMLMNPNQWISGLGLAICILTGQAVINSETLVADQPAVEVTIDDVFDRFDTNKNGQLEKSECLCKCAQECDLDKDGAITRKEFKEGVKQLAGSHDNLIRLVQKHGGLEKFYVAVQSGLLDEVAAVSMDTVFAHLDTNQSGVLEPAECICPGSKCADLNTDGKVTKAELTEVAIKFFGSEKAFLNEVRQQGGVKQFFASLEEEQADGVKKLSTVDAVFAQYDKDGSGALEKSECICQGTKMADADQDGKVTKQELRQVATQMFGSIEKFEKYIGQCGGAKKFYEAVASGKLK